ncbi:hypothetical protein NOR_00289 [Metarhizium rileyi]|uniref:Uncharacterized protein n=1 Tax=Metarhizium rileyi (strain RCEF 4871) TaxID=1649241 RepID=A0A167KG91_METRR|nr:hypothetical protein NOR_00289 [Metarhizium rileyi RCEF 4871]
MSESDRDQALVATFAFGAVVCASLGIVLFHLRGGALSLLRGGLRLVLAGFLLFATLWAVDGFIATFIDRGSTAGCQIAISFAAAFDQLARIALEEFLFWAMNGDIRPTLGVLFPQAVIFIRFIIGGIFVGVQRPQFKLVCVATNILWPLGVVVLCMDAFIVLALVTRASSVGVFRDLKAEDLVGSRSRGISLTMVALGLWIPLSVPMLLGISTFGIVTRTALPAAGVLVVIGIIALYFQDLILPQRVISQKTAAYLDNFPGLPDTVPPPTRQLGNQAVSAVNPSYTPNRSARPREDSRSNTSRAISSRDGNDSLSIISRPSPGQAMAGVGGFPVKGELFPPARTNSKAAKQGMFRVQATKKAVTKGGKLVISYPRVQEDKLTEASPLRRIATVDLATAARQDKERRINPTAPQKSYTARYSNQNGKELERKRISGGHSTRQTRGTILEPIQERSSQGTSSTVLATSTTPSGDIRQRSPSHISECFQDTLPPEIPVRNRSRPNSGIPTSQDLTSEAPLKPPPRSPLRPSSGHPSIANALQGPTRPSNVSLNPMSDGAEGPKDSASPFSSQQTSQVPTSESENVPRRVSNASTTKSIDVLVPPVPPLSPRNLGSRTYYPLEKNLGSQYGENGPSSNIPRGNAVKNNIRPSRQKVATPPPVDEAKSVKTPVQLRGTVGLPNNPRARAAEASVNKTQHQTVMLVNSMEYNDSSRIREMIDEMAADLATRTNGADSGGRDSVVHRPRPIPRKSQMTKSVLPKKSPRKILTDELPPSSKERHVSSEPSASTSIVRESPSKLSSVPPPPLPTSVHSNSERSRPRKAKTPISQNDTDNSTKVPGTTFQTQTPDDQPRRAKEVNMKPSTVTLVEYTETLLPGKSKANATRYASKFSIATTMTPEDPPSEYLQSPALPPLLSTQQETRRKSSPILPLHDVQESSTDVSIMVDQPETSPIAPQDLVAGNVSNSQGIPSVAANMPERASYANSTHQNYVDDGKEMVTFMLDQNTYHQTCATTTASAQSSVHGGTEDKTSSWHCRVGDNPPTFSGRESMQARRSPKPPPLKLDKVSKRVQRPRPQTSPLETPRQALDQIQEQLNKLEDTSVIGDADFEQHRMSLLKDIEMEMGIEQNRWQKMRDDLARISVSTVGSNLISPFSNEASPMSAQNVQSPTIEEIEKSLLVKGPYLSVWGKNTGRPRSSVIYTADQVRMGQSKIVSNKLQVTTADDTTRLSERVAEEVSVASRKASPGAASTPLKSERARTLTTIDQSSINEVEEEARFKKRVLWRPNHTDRSPEIIKSQTALWNSAPAGAIQSMSLPSPGPRPARRESRVSSPVEESGLWDNPSESLAKLATSPSLWKVPHQSPKLPAPSQEPPPRRNTLRPPRKSKRISLLPDIVENPEPLKNKRDTLGLFRFPCGGTSDIPWEETSDTAISPASSQNDRFKLPANNGTGAPPKYPTLELQMQTLQSQQQPSSFFDYNDEDEAVVEILEYSNNDSFYEDDEDEAIYEEIVRYFNFDMHNDSALPGPWVAQRPTIPNRTNSVPRAQQSAGEEETEASTDESSHPLLPHRGSSSPTLPPSEATLWVNNVCTPPQTAIQGLLQDEALWNVHLENQCPTTRTPLRQVKKASSITSTSLWSRPLSETDTAASNRLWSNDEPQPMAEPVVRVKEIVPRPTVTPEQEFTWSAPKPTPTKAIFGLPQPKPEHWDKYKNLGRRALRRRLRNVGHLAIKSQSLWSEATPQEAQTLQHSDSGEATKSPSNDKDDGKTPSAMLMVTGDLHAASSDITPVTRSPIDCLGSQETVIRIDEQPAYDENNSTEPQDDIATPSHPGSDLWVPFSVLPMDEEQQGLFQVQHGSHQQDKYRGTSLPPAALGIRPTPRLHRWSLQDLESQALWTAATPQTFAQDWVTLSSIRPSTPPDQLISESGSDSPLSDSFSVYSNNTGESTIGSFLTGQASVQSKPQVYTDTDWMATIPETEPPSRPETEVAIPGPDQEAQQQDAKDECKPAATEAKTETETCAPEEPLSPLSSHRQTHIGGFDPARHHPVFNVDVLDTSNGDCHPAAQGYIHTLVN